MQDFSIIFYAYEALCVNEMSLLIFGDPDKDPNFQPVIQSFFFNLNIDLHSDYWCSVT